ncbi:unnamed protein product, partial [marine sediment metagenome]
STQTPIINNIMNSKGGIDYVDGRVDDFRYYNTNRDLPDIRADYNTSLSGVEDNLVHYYKFDGDLTDSAGNDDCVKATPDGGFYSGVLTSTNIRLDLEVQFTGVYDSPNITE